MNDLSLHGQFSDFHEFQESVGHLMQLRNIAQKNGRSIYCHRNLVNRHVTAQARLSEAVRSMPLDAQRAILGWLSRYGPFWDDEREHAGSDWYEFREQVVTETAIAEAAHCLLHGIDRRLVSLAPSDYTYDPIEVDLVSDDESRKRVDVPNCWDRATLEAALTTASPPPDSWPALADLCKTRFDSLTISAAAFEPLRGQPFKSGVAERIVALLSVLQELKGSFDERGSRTAEGHDIYQRHFTGSKAWFSDSSDGEKRDYESDLTFPHPSDSEGELFCTWHGKVKSPQYRIHFSWPVTATRPLFVVYVGPKITKR